MDKLFFIRLGNQIVNNEVLKETEVIKINDLLNKYKISPKLLIK